MAPGSYMESKLDLFIRRTESDLEYIRARVDKLWEFRLMVIGGSMVISTICSFIVSAIYAYLRIH